MGNRISAHSPKLGFTLVELLIVVAIIGVLVSITVPAVMYARRVAQNTACLNNLRELGRATISFETTRKKYPASFTSWSNSPQVAEIHPWIVQILPELDQQLVYDEIQTSGLSTVQTVIAVLACPGEPKAGRSPGEFSYAVNAGLPDDGLVEQANAGSGVFYDRSVRAGASPQAMTSQRVRDGLSQTILFAENANISDNSVRWNAGQQTENLFCVTWLHDVNGNPPAVVLAGNYFEGNREAILLGTWEFSRPVSWHAKSFNVVFADGRAESVQSSIAYEVYAKLMTSDGRAVTVPGVTNGFWRGPVGDDLQ